MITFYLNPDKPLLEDFDLTLCLGYFDGLHIGHQDLIAKAKALGKEVGVMTLSRSPRFVVKGLKEEFLTAIEDRERILEALGVDYLFVVEFSKKTASFTPFEFFELVIEQVNPKNIVCGPDYRFGKNGEGNIDTLKKFCGYFKNLVVVDFLKDKGEKISSGDILLNIKAGKIKPANELLTRPYSITGQVVQGLGNGEKLGYRTANIVLNDNYVVPRNGVYAARGILQNEEYSGMVNIGVHPSLDQLENPSIEIHLFDFTEEIYGLDLRIEFLDFIREEQKFASLDELKRQLQADEKRIKEDYFR